MAVPSHPYDFASPPMRPICWTSLAVAAALFLAFGCSDSAAAHVAIVQDLRPILGGERASIDEYPATVAITDVAGEPFCTGTMLSPKLVVTAAHCLVDWWGRPQQASVMRVVYGYEAPAIAPPDQRREVTLVRPHPSYNPYGETDADGLAQTNDIGLLVLQQPIEGAAVAALLSERDLDRELTADRHVHIAGFGVTDLQSQSAGVLYKAVTPHVRHTRWEMLAGRLGQPDTCNGDSGGPAYLLIGDQLRLVGVTSRAWPHFTQPCGEGGIYTLAPAYRSWIETVEGPLPSQADPDAGQSDVANDAGVELPDSDLADAAVDHQPDDAAGMDAGEAAIADATEPDAVVGDGFAGDVFGDDVVDGSSPCTSPSSQCGATQPGRAEQGSMPQAGEPSGGGCQVSHAPREPRWRSGLIVTLAGVGGLRRRRRAR